MRARQWTSYPAYLKSLALRTPLLLLAGAAVATGCEGQIVGEEDILQRARSSVLQAIQTKIECCADFPAPESERVWRKGISPQSHRVTEITESPL